MSKKWDLTRCPKHATMKLSDYRANKIMKGCCCMTIDEVLTAIDLTGEITTVEEMRTKVVGMRDTLVTVRDDILGYQQTVNDQQTEIDNLHAEVERLKEQNGRLYRERINNRMDETVEEINKALDKDVEIKKLKETIKL